MQMKDAGGGIVAMEDIHAGETVFSLPESTLADPSAAFSSWLSPALRSIGCLELGEWTIHLQMCFYVFLTYSMGMDEPEGIRWSRLEPVLPRIYDNAVNWSEEEVSLLSGIVLILTLALILPVSINSAISPSR